MTSLRERLLGPEPAAVRHLVKAVAKDLGPDLNRLEQNIVPRVARHA
jgi:hypothetical protein